MSYHSHFWAWARDADTEERVLYFEGPIASETWLEDEISPALFRSELYSDNGPITIYMNSEGGDCIAASSIYTMLIEYPWDVTIKIHGIAASAASVVAMSGTRVLMAPTSFLMLHNPLTAAFGDSEEMKKAIERLEVVKDSIINAYQIRTNLSRAQLSHMMDGETWLPAQKAIAMGFADGLLTDQKRVTQPEKDAYDHSYMFSRRAVTNSLLTRLRARLPRDEPLMMKVAVDPTPPVPEPEAPKPTGIPAESLIERLFTIPHEL
jgi:ATP-dependent Clp protease protease subunit